MAFSRCKVSIAYHLSEFYSDVRDISFMNIVALCTSQVVISTNPVRLKKIKENIKQYVSVSIFKNYSRQTKNIYFVKPFETWP